MGFENFARGPHPQEKKNTGWLGLIGGFRKWVLAVFAVFGTF